MTVQDTNRYTVDLKPNYIFISWIQGRGVLKEGGIFKGGRKEHFANFWKMQLEGRESFEG